MNGSFARFTVLFERFAFPAGNLGGNTEQVLSSHFGNNVGMGFIFFEEEEK